MANIPLFGSTSTSTTTPSAFGAQAAQSAITNAATAANQPWQQYSADPNAFVAGLNTTQQAGIANTNASAGQAQPYFNAAQSALGAGVNQAMPFVYGGGQDVNAQQIGGQQIGQFMSPYLGSVYSAMLAGQGQQNAQQQSNLKSGAIGAGAFGGDRAGIGQANLAYQQNLANAQTNANMLNTGYGQALGAAQQQQGVNLGAQQANRAAQAATGQSLYGMGMGTSQQLAALGTGAQTAGLQGAAAQMGAGAAQQKTSQDALTAMYNQFLQSQAYPFQTGQYYTSTVGSLMPLLGGTTSTYTPGIVGFARGGSIRGAYAGGGLIPSSMGGGVGYEHAGEGYADGGMPGGWSDYFQNSLGASGFSPPTTYTPAPNQGGYTQAPGQSAYTQTPMPTYSHVPAGLGAATTDYGNIFGNLSHNTAAPSAQQQYSDSQLHNVDALRSPLVHAPEVKKDDTANPVAAPSGLAGMPYAGTSESGVGGAGQNMGANAPLTSAGLLGDVAGAWGARGDLLNILGSAGKDVLTGLGLIGNEPAAEPAAEPSAEAQPTGGGAQAEARGGRIHRTPGGPVFSSVQLAQMQRNRDALQNAMPYGESGAANSKRIRTLPGAPHAGMPAGLAAAQSQFPSPSMQSSSSGPLEGLIDTYDAGKKIYNQADSGNLGGALGDAAKVLGLASGGFAGRGHYEEGGDIVPTHEYFPTFSAPAKPERGGTGAPSGGGGDGLGDLVKLAGLAGSLFSLSDARLKENIERVGKTYDGQNIIKFNYKGSPTTHMGLIAQEVEHHHPEAVGSLHGYKTVDYDKATQHAADRGHYAGGGLAGGRHGYEGDGTVVPAATDTNTDTNTETNTDQRLKDIISRGNANADASTPEAINKTIAEAAAKRGIPIDLARAMFKQESSLDPNLTGGAKEIGLGQILPSTARNPGYGMTGVDPATLVGPENIDKNVNFSLDYLKAKGLAGGASDLNDPTQRRTALAGYNGGGDPNYVQNVERHMFGASQVPADGAVERPGANISQFGNARTPTPQEQAAADASIRLAGKIGNSEPPDWYGRNKEWVSPLLKGISGLRGARNLAGALVGAAGGVASGLSDVRAQNSAIELQQAQAEQARGQGVEATGRASVAPATRALTESQAAETWATLGPKVDKLVAENKLTDAQAARIRTMTPVDAMRELAQAGLYRAQTVYSNAQTANLTALTQPQVDKLIAKGRFTNTQAQNMQNGFFVPYMQPNGDLWLYDAIQHTYHKAGGPMTPTASSAPAPAPAPVTPPPIKTTSWSPILTAREAALKAEREGLSPDALKPIIVNGPGVPPGAVAAAMESAQAKFNNQDAKAQAASSTILRLKTMNDQFNKLPTTGLLAPGPLSESRMTLAKNLNDIVQALGGNPIWPNDQVASIEAVKKDSFGLGAAATAALGSNEAARVLENAISNNPGLANTKQGYKLISSAMQQIAQREIDYRNFMLDMRNNHYSVDNAAAIFNAANPPEKYAHQAILNTVDPAHAQILRNNADDLNTKHPGTHPASLNIYKDIERMYGKGTAELILGGA